MGIWTDWMRRARKKQAEAKPKQGNLVERLLQGQFFLMVLPVRGIELEEKYQCRSVEREKIPSFWKSWRDDQGLMLEVEGVGTCLFSTLVDELPAKLQSRFRSYRCYVFGANDTYGYFKILEQGRIVRKIASDGQIRFQGRSISSYPQVLGEPCAYEREQGACWEMDHRAKWRKDQVVGFGRREVLDLLDYYVGLRNLTDGRIVSARVYQVYL